MPGKGFPLGRPRADSPSGALGAWEEEQGEKAEVEGLSAFRRTHHLAWKSQGGSKAHLGPGEPGERASLPGTTQVSWNSGLRSLLSFQTPALYLAILLLIDQEALSVHYRKILLLDL